VQSRAFGHLHHHINHRLLQRYRPAGAGRHRGTIKLDEPARSCLLAAKSVVSSSSAFLMSIKWAHLSKVEHFGLALGREAGLRFENSASLRAFKSPI
jgi:hypothetical protein